jgi:hypothetical protein
VNVAPAEPNIRDPFVLYQSQGSTLAAPLQEEGPGEIHPDNHPERSKSALDWGNDSQTDVLWALYTPIRQT